MKASFEKYFLDFKIPGGTSRGVLKQKETFFITITTPTKKGIGECGLFRGLSIDDVPDYEERLNWACLNIQIGLSTLLKKLIHYPSIQFGLEQAFLDLDSIDHELFPSPFTRGEKSIPINGLIWMGDISFMKSQIKDKLDNGFRCVKLKISAANWNEEKKFIQQLRNRYKKKELEIRVDANGAFSYKEAVEVLKELSDLDIHSIEQPIKQGQIAHMAKLCSQTPTPIALDEELIGVFDKEKKQRILQTIKPQYIILKPSLVGGFKGSEEWIYLANKNNINWWVTSALESNIGLNAIAQWTYTLQNKLPQGLGTGGLFTNNTSSKLVVKQQHMWYIK
jgi:o-succinylbenzoate synthase